MLKFLYKEKGLDPVTTLPRLGMDSGDGSLKAIFNLVDLRSKASEGDQEAVREEEEEEEDEMESDDEDDSEEEEEEEDDDIEEEEEDEEEEWEEVVEEEIDGEYTGEEKVVEEDLEGEVRFANEQEDEWLPASWSSAKSKPKPSQESKKRKIRKSLKAFYKDSG